MRTENSIKNSIVAAIMTVINIVIGFVAQKIFIIELGNEYLGLNSLFSNIISMLAIVELGFGSAITYNLYKPLADNDKESVKTLINFYKITYRVISAIVFMAGICLLPFLNSVVGEVNIVENIYIIFMLYLIDTTASYWLTYKRSILYASQKTYIVNIIHIIYLFVMNTLQIFILILTKNFILYLFIKIICRIIENIAITLIANKRYPYLKEKDIKKISNKTKSNIITKIKGLLFHKIGSFIVLGTDNIIISKFLGVVSVGLYSNYNLVISAVSNLFGQIFSSLTATVGNLLIENNKQKTYDIYRKIMFFDSILFTFASAAILCLMEPFVTIWLGKEYLLSHEVLIILVINFYLQGIRKAYGLFKEGAGIFYEDRIVPILESLVNIIFSIILVKIFGLAGVFLGTIASCLVLYVYSFPKFVYKGLFGKSYMNYIIDNLRYMIPSTIAIFISAKIINRILINNVLLELLIKGIMSIIISNIIMILIFCKTDEFKYYKNLIIEIVNKIRKREMKTN